MATTKKTLYIEYALSDGSKYSMPVDNPKEIGEEANATTTTPAAIKAAAEQGITGQVVASDGKMATSFERAYIRTITDSDVNIPNE